MSQNLDTAPDHHRHEGTSGPEPWRTLFIVTALLLVVSVVALVLSLTVFRTTNAPEPTPTPTASVTPTPTPTTTPAVALCTTSNSKVTVGQPSGTAGSTVIPLVFTNTSAAPCTLMGYPTVAFVGHGNGTQIGAASQQDTTVAPRLTTIAPGASAGSMATVVEAGNVCSSPVAVDGFRVIPPGSKGAFFVPVTGLETCAAGQSLLTVTAIAGA
jgi:Protein of unknown function (DUF4232)